MRFSCFGSYLKIFFNRGISFLECGGTLFIIYERDSSLILEDIRKEIMLYSSAVTGRVWDYRHKYLIIRNKYIFCA